jgi:hypothetical protein
LNVKLAISLSLALFAFAGAGIRGDELKLKDGSKVIGTIVGFEDNSFKVKTNYGFAVVQKDQVVSVKIEDASPVATETNPVSAPEKSAAKSADPAKPSSRSPESAKSPEKSATKASSSEAPVSAIAVAPPPASKVSAPLASRAPAQASLSSSGAPAPDAVAAAVPASGNAPASVQPTALGKPTPPVQPPPIREEVTGNSYTNDTYAFRMYKPPDWDVIASPQTMMPGAVAAMGTQDQSTYLIIGVEPTGKSETASIDATEKRLRNMLENFRDTGNQPITVSGLSAMEEHFHGGADGHDWSGVMVFLPRAGNLYTIFGMTYAESDLVQIQENVIGRAISSLQFLQQ